MHRFASALPALGFALALGLAARAPAATVVTTTAAAAPVENVTIFFEPTDKSGLAWRADSSVASLGWRDVGQAFVIGESVTLDTITLVTRSAANDPDALNASFTLTLLSFGNDLGSLSSTPTVVETFTGSTPNAVIASGTFLTFDLGGFELTKDDDHSVYGFLLHFDSEAPGRSISFQQFAGGESYADGRRIIGDGNAFGSNLNYSPNSLQFYLQTSASAVPEPGSASLALAGSALAFAFLHLGRRSRR